MEILQGKIIVEFHSTTTASAIPSLGGLVAAFPSLPRQLLVAEAEAGVAVGEADGLREGVMEQDTSIASQQRASAPFFMEARIGGMVVAADFH